MIKLLICVAVLACALYAVEARQCWACSDTYPDLTNGTTCKSGARLKQTCQTATQSCASVITSDGELNKICLIDKDGNPYSLP
ncbi:hypothetical protein M3Y97_00010300 [Aphelenchoides bicaudatus]|nr:hypothetical protein M3Y97_00010300 [Aphelenchoides bicaudatus]